MIIITHKGVNVAAADAFSLPHDVMSVKLFFVNLNGISFNFLVCFLVRCRQQSDCVSIDKKIPVSVFISEVLKQKNITYSKKS